MRKEYIEKILSYDFNQMNIGELIEYLIFVHEKESYKDNETNSTPFKNKPAEVIQFIVKKYGCLDRDLK